MAEAILAVDVGSGTQDILLYLPGRTLENCPKLVMPSRTQIVASQIRQVTAQRKNLFLSGTVMGGGASTVALKDHLKAGLRAYATPLAAKTFNDDLEIVKSMGVELVDCQPKDALEVVLGDLDIRCLEQAFGAFGIELPACFAVAVQDHGECPGVSNRIFRFRLWQEFILQGGDLKRLIFQQAPDHFTRMKAVQSLRGQCWVMDTGSAAVWGILCDPLVSDKLERGIIALNIGNSHTLGVAIKGFRVMGLFEHHTGLINPDFLAQQVKKLQAGSLTNEEVFSAGGHGAFLHPDYSGGFEFVALTGPRWEMARGLNFYRVAPYGDMMLSGCFGLLSAMGVI